MGTEDNLIESELGMRQTTLKYFLTMLPVLMSMGIGGAAMGILAWIIDYIWRKIQKLLYCSMIIKYDDDTFKWVNKYMRDNGLMKGDG